METTTSTVAAVVGYVLFGISEVMPLLPVPASGMLHSLILGLSNAFKSPTKDIEMAQSIVSHPTFANIVNTISTNTQLQSIVSGMISDPSTINSIAMSNSNTKLLSVINNNPQLLHLIELLGNDHSLINTIDNILTNSPGVISKVESNVSIIEKLNTQIEGNILQLMNSPHLSSTINNMTSLSPIQLENTLTIIDNINTNPSILDTLVIKS